MGGFADLRVDEVYFASNSISRRLRSTLARKCAITSGRGV